MHKTKLPQEKVLEGEQHEGTIQKKALKNIINFLKIIGLLLKIKTMLPTPSTIKFIQTKNFELF